MAKARDLAALAGLAGLAYAMRNKDKGMTPEQNDTLANANRVSRMSDDSDTLARVNRNMSSGQNAVDDTNAGVLNAILRPKASADTGVDDTTAEMYPSGVMGGARQQTASKPAARLKSKRMSDAQNDMLAKAGRDLAGYRNEDYGNESMRPVTSTPTMLPGSDPFEPLRSGTRHPRTGRMMNKGGSVKKMASGGITSSASKRADGIATKGKTRGRIC